jgi:hypothetical protein
MLNFEHIGQFDTWPAEFGRDGTLVTPLQIELLRDAAAQATDLLVISHGWNNDTDEASALYRELIGNLSNIWLSGSAADARKLIVMRVYWPSKRFAEADLIAGGAASGADVGGLIAGQIDELLKDYKDVANADVDHPDRIKLHALQGLRALLPRLEEDDGAQEDFVRLIRVLLAPSVNDEEEVLQDNFMASDGSDLLKKLSRPFRPRVPAGGGAMSVDDGPPIDWNSPGGAATLGNFFRGVFNGAQNLLNLFTYYEMKERAGVVGRSGVVDVLRRIQEGNPSLRLHLCGHSFGGRLVAAVLAFRDPPAESAQGIRSVMLLQAAFSHNGFAQKYDGSHDGFFRAAFDGKRLNGPVVITHTDLDHAVGLAYPIASRLRQQVASGLGDAKDPYGAIGRNGALAKFAKADVDPAVVKLKPVGDPYPLFQPRRIYNLEGAGFITGHSDVRGPEVAQALKHALDASV